MKNVQALVNRSTTNQDGFLVSDYATDYIFRGQCFGVTDTVEIAGSTTLNFVFNCSCGENIVNLPPSFNATGGHVLITIYAGTDYVGVNELNVRNRNVKSTIKPKCTIKDLATGSVIGQKTSKYVVPSGHKAGGGDSGDLPYILNGYNYLITVENTDSSAIVFGYKFIWFEG